MKKSLLDLIPRHIRTMASYVPGKVLKQAQRESGVAMIKLASNENPFGPSPLAIEAIRAAKVDDASLKIQNEFYEKSKHPLDTRP